MASIERQLLSNQLWESVGFVAKGAFLLGLTPAMVRQWGSQGYGEFALASSVFVLLSLTDLGIRARTRLSLCRAVGKPTVEAAVAFSQGLLAFAWVGALTLGACFPLSRLGLESRLFGISPNHRYLIFGTATLSIEVMLSGLLLEPLVAAGRIGSLKCATALGWLTAIPLTGLVLLIHGSVFLAVASWLGSLLLANLFTFAKNFSAYRGLSLLPQRLTGFIGTIRESFWFNLCNASWAAKTYGTTLLLSALYGPATAGFFFILLRLSEIISMLGAISCDVLLGELAQGSSLEARLRSFKSSYRYALLLCTHLALLVGFCTGDVYRIWVPSSPPLPFYAGAVVAMLGLASAINRKAVYAAMGLGAVRLAALCGLIESVAFLAVVGLLPVKITILNRLALASFAATALWPIMRRINRELGRSFAEIWLRPLGSVLPFAGVNAFGLALAFSTNSYAAKGGAVALAGFLLLLNVASLYRQANNIKAHHTGSPAKTEPPVHLRIIQPSTKLEQSYVSPYLHPNHDRSRAAHPVLRHLSFFPSALGAWTVRHRRGL